MDAWWRLYLSLILVSIVHITWTFSLEFNLSTHQFHFEAGVMTAWNAWNPPKFDTIWNKVGPHVIAWLRTMQLYNKLWSRSCDPRYKAFWPRFHAQPWSREAIHPYPAPSFPSAELHVHWLQPWGKIGKGSKVSEFDEWNRIRHCRSGCSLSLYWFGVLAWHISIVSPSCTKNPRQLLHWNSPTC